MDLKDYFVCIWLVQIKNPWPVSAGKPRITRTITELENKIEWLNMARETRKLAHNFILSLDRLSTINTKDNKINHHWIKVCLKLFRLIAKSFIP